MTLPLLMLSACGSSVSNGEEGDANSGHIFQGLSPGIALERFIPIQPGWARIVARYEGMPGGTSFTLGGFASWACSASAPRVNLVDQRVSWDVRWTAGRCSVTPHVSATAGGSLVADAVAPTGHDIGIPFASLSRWDVDRSAAVSSVSVAGRVYLAYPARTVAIVSAPDSSDDPRAIALAEFEELPARGTLGVRHITVFRRSPPFGFELGGGGELADGFELDVDRRGITRAPILVETGNFLSMRFDDAIGVVGPLTLWNPSMMPARAAVLPFPPVFSESVYQTEVLHNFVTPPVLLPGDEADVRYDASTNSLVALAGASLVALDANLPPLETVGSIVTEIGSKVIAESYLTPTSFDEVDMQTPVMDSVPHLSPVAEPASEKFIEDATAILQLPVRKVVDEGLAFVTAQEHIQYTPPAPIPAAGCVLSSDGTTLGSTTPCTPAAGCPTSATFEPEALSPAPGDAGSVGVIDVVSPYYLSRDNGTGSCVGHTEVQQVETLLNRYLADEGPRRAAFLDGERIPFPEPRVALSVGGWIWAVFNTLGTQQPFSPVRDWDPSEKYKLPLFPMAEWPALEAFNMSWNTAPGTPASAYARKLCGSNAWTGFCAGHGGPPPSIYRTYSEMVQSLADDPLRDGIYSLVHAHNPIHKEEIALGDRGDAAVAAIVDELRAGRAVALTFVSQLYPRPEITAPANVNARIFTSEGWFMPPELAGCDFGQRGFAGGGGHAVLVVGARFVTAASGLQDPYRSYFVVRNNWGKFAGVRGFHFMSFAAFRHLAFGATKATLDRRCASAACRYH